MPNADIERLLQRGAETGIISVEQLAGLRRLADLDGAPRGAMSRLRRDFTGVRLAYAIGALLVLFASGWFLFDQWEKLGAPGVLVFVSVYAAAIVAFTRWLRTRALDEAADLTTMLAVSLTPLAVWALMSLAALWPDRAERAISWSFTHWHWVVLELATILVALLVLRARPVAAVAYPAAAALWGLQYHLGRVFHLWTVRAPHERWTNMAFALATLVIAESIDRWQLARVGDAKEDGGDFAQPFWIVGIVAFILAYAELWDGAGRWRHALPILSLGFAWVAIVLRRRLLVLASLGGMVVYLAWLTDSVFRNVVSFPILLAVIGLLTIGATVWVQRRFAGLSRGSDGARLGASRPLPWSRVTPLVAPFFAVVMAVASIREGREKEMSFEFSQRREILRAHSHRFERYRERHDSPRPETAVPNEK